MSITNITINTVDTAAMVLDQLDPQNGADAGSSLQRIERYVGGLADGAFYFNTVTEQVGAIQATGTLTVSSTGPTNGEAGSVANQAITAVTSGAVPSSGQFNISATPSVVATGIALAINSVVALQHTVSATAAGGVVTITAKHAGVSGNGLQLSAGNLANTVAAAMAGGSNGTEVVIA